MTAAENQGVSAIGPLPRIAITDPTEARKLDREYSPFPAFAEWQGLMVDSARWDAKLKEYAGRAERSTGETLSLAIETALIAAAIDTGAIEGLYVPQAGFTISVATREPGWESRVSEMGADFQSHFEAQLRAYGLALKLGSSPGGVTEAWVRELHTELAKNQRTYRVLTAVGWQDHDLPLGEYKQHPNHVRMSDGTMHAYAPVDGTADEMHRLVREFEGAEFTIAHPVLQASYAHFALVAVHPFADGNGRVARALASTFLSRKTGVPLVIFVDQRDRYFASLEIADRGNHQPFVDFIFDRCMDSLEFVAYRLGPSPMSQVERLESILRGAGPMSPAEIDQQAAKFFQLLQAEVQLQLVQLKMPPDVQLNQQTVFVQLGNEEPRYRGYMSGGSQQVLRLMATTISTPRVDLPVDLPVLSVRDNTQRHICAVRNSRTGALLEVRPDEIIALQPTSALRLKLRAWVESVIAETLADFALMYEQAAKQ